MENENPVITPSNELMPPTEPKPKFRLSKRDSLLIAAAVVAVLVMGWVMATQTNLLGMSSKAVAQKAVDFLNTNKDTYLQGQSAELVNAAYEKGLVKMNLKIGGSDYVSYVTRDGKILFPSAIEIK